jgi:hypothetical protein
VTHSDTHSDTHPFNDITKNNQKIEMNLWQQIISKKEYILKWVFKD